MVQAYTPGTRCTHASGGKICTPSIPEDAMTLESCLECCRLDDECIVVEFMALGSSGICTTLRACDRTFASPGDRTATFKKVKAGSFDSPQWMMVCSVAPVMTTPCMTEQLYNEVVDSVQNLVRGLSGHCDEDSCEQADFAGCVLRMAGHDFMDYNASSGLGGADACTDMGDPDNAGLPECLYEGEFGGKVSLNNAYWHFCGQVSLADFIVIAAEAVMSFLAQGESKAHLAEDFRRLFRYGRTTAFEGCAFSRGALPNPEESCLAVKSCFVDRLRLSWTQAAALMGVHTLGRAQTENSGYSGWWSDAENSRRFNNDYFVSILAKGWCVEQNVNNCSSSAEAAGDCVRKNQWQRCDVGSQDNYEMMLDTDMCLAFSDGEDGDGVLQAGHDDCCAWVHTMAIPGGKTIGGDFNMSNIVAANGNTFCNVECGSDIDVLDENGEPFQCFNDKLRQAMLETQACCIQRSNKPRNDCRSEGLGLGRGPGGPASEAVRQFAEDEAAWMEVFLGAWTTVTRNGYSEEALKPLGQC